MAGNKKKDEGYTSRGPMQKSRFSEEELALLEEKLKDPHTVMMEDYEAWADTGNIIYNNDIVTNYQHPDDYGVPLGKPESAQAYRNGAIANIVPQVYQHLVHKGYIVRWKDDHNVAITESQIAQYMNAKNALKNAEQAYGSNYQAQFTSQSYTHQKKPYPHMRYLGTKARVALFNDEVLAGPIMPVRDEIQKIVDATIRSVAKQAGIETQSREL